MKSNHDGVSACMPPLSRCNFVDSQQHIFHQFFFFLLSFVIWCHFTRKPFQRSGVKWCCSFASQCAKIFFICIRSITSGWQVNFYSSFTTIVGPSVHWLTQLFEGHRLLPLAQTKLYHTLTTYIPTLGLLTHTPESAGKNNKKSNVNSNWITIDLTDCELRYQEYQQPPHITHRFIQEHLQPICEAGAGVNTIKMQ